MLCKVCKIYFKARKEERYEIEKRNGIADSITGNAVTVYEAFDCPKCGCQNIVNVRERSINCQYSGVRYQKFKEEAKEMKDNE